MHSQPMQPTFQPVYAPLRPQEPPRIINSSLGQCRNCVNGVCAVCEIVRNRPTAYLQAGQTEQVINSSYARNSRAAFPVLTTERVVEFPAANHSQLILERPSIVGQFATASSLHQQSVPLPQQHLQHHETMSMASQLTTLHHVDAPQPRSTSTRPSNLLEEKVYTREIKDKRLVDQQEWDSLQSLRAHSSTLQSTVHRLEEEISLHRSNAQIEIDRLHREIREINDKANVEREEVAKKIDAKEEIARQRAERVGELEAEVKGLRAHVVRVEAENQELAGAKHEAEIKVRKMAVELNSMTQYKEMLGQEVAHKLKLADDRNLDLEKQILDLQDTIARLQKEHREYKEKQLTLDSNVHSQNTHLYSKVTKEQTIVDNPEHIAKLREKAIRIDQLTESLSASESKVRQLEHAKRELEEEINTMQGQYTKLGLQVSTLETKLASTEENYQKKLEALMESVREEKQKCDAYFKIVEGLKKKVKYHEEELDGVSRDKQKLAGQLREAESKCHMKDIEIDKLTKFSDAKSKEIATLENEIILKNQKISASSRSISDLESEIANLKYQIKNMESLISKLEADSLKVPTLEEDIRLLTGEIERLQGLLEQLSAQNQNSQEATAQQEMNSQEEQQNGDNEEYVAELEAKVEECDGYIQELEQKLAEMESEVDKIKKFCEKLISDNSILQQQVREFQEGSRSGRNTEDLGQDLNERVIMQLQRLISLNNDKDEEIRELTDRLEETIKVANDRQLMLEQSGLDKGRLAMAVTEAYQEIDRAQQHLGLVAHQGQMMAQAN
jgi:chromosome segregation ATPase